MTRLWGGTGEERQWQSDSDVVERAKKWYLRQEKEAMRPGNIIGLFFAGLLVGAALVGIIWLTVSIMDGN